MTFEPRRGGSVFETRHDGETVDWAEVIDWEPGHRVSLAWHVGRARAHATRVDVNFQPLRDGGTEVVLLHSGFEVLGGVAGEAAAASYDEGWDLVLGERFREACEQ